IGVNISQVLTMRIHLPEKKYAPPKGSCEATLADATPGSALRRFCKFSWKALQLSGGAYFFSGRWIRIVSTWEMFTPIGALYSFTALRIINPAPANSTTHRAI